MAKQKTSKIDVNAHDRLAVYGVEDFEHNGDEKSRWTLIGTAFQNKDGSFNIKANYWPTNGANVQIRPFQPKEEQE